MPPLNTMLQILHRAMLGEIPPVNAAGVFVHSHRHEPGFHLQEEKMNYRNQDTV